MSWLIRTGMFVCCLWSIKIYATISPLTIEIYNASRVVKPDVVDNSTNSTGTISPTGNIKVYAGINGPNCTGTSTCNNCGAENKPCNAARISPDGLLHFVFQTDSTTAITASSALFMIGPNNTKIPPVPGEFSTELAVNSLLTVKFKWSDVCAAVGSPSCGTGISTPQTVQVGLSSNADNTLDEYFSVDIYVVGTHADDVADYTNLQYFTPCPTVATATDAEGGYCSLDVERGDEKVYITNEIHGTNFNRAPNGVTYKYLRVYYAVSETGCTAGNQNTVFAATVTSASPYKDLTFTLRNGSYFLDDPTLTGLTNGSTYLFRFANVDEAGNVFYFSGDHSIDSTPGLELKGYLNCLQHSAAPAEVVGLLDGKDCFIATAAFGSPLAPQLDILREFRNRFLLTNSLGRWLVQQYYIYSPSLAAKIKKRDSARAIVRTTLSPVITVAQWLILHGLKSFLILAATGFVLGFVIVRRLIKTHD
jgi:hypothetical protein